MSLLKKVQQRSVERKFGGTHPILRMGLDRNAVDAYFTGLVFAAVADDEAIDEYERQKLLRVGSALSISEEDVRTMMSDMLARDSDAKIAIAEECANVLKGSPSVRLFVCEWSQVWMSHEYKQDELDEFREQLCEWLGWEPEEKFFKLFDSAVQTDRIGDVCIGELFEFLPDECLAYFFGGEEIVDREKQKWRQAKLEANKKAEKAAAQKAKEEAAQRRKIFLETFSHDVEACCAQFYNLDFVTDEHLNVIRSALGKYFGRLSWKSWISLASEVTKRFEDEMNVVETEIERDKNPRTQIAYQLARYSPAAAKGMIGQPWVESSLRKGLWSLACIATVALFPDGDFPQNWRRFVNKVFKQARTTICKEFHTTHTLREFWESNIVSHLTPRREGEKMTFTFEG